MGTTDAGSACTAAGIDDVSATGRLEVRQEPGRISIYTGKATVRHSQRSARLGGAALAVAGIVLLWYSPWGVAVVVLGILTALLAPRFLRPVKLLEFDTDRQQFNIVQSSVGAGAVVPIACIQHIRGEYDTKGWNGYSVLYAVDGHGEESPILMLLGSDEQLAEAACKTLGALLNKPAVYTGPFGQVRDCFSPVAIGDVQNDDDPPDSQIQLP